MKTNWFLVLVVALCCCACQERYETDWLVETQKMQAQYSELDAEGAAVALRRYIDKLESESRDRARGIDYEFCLGIAHARLFVVYRHIENHDKSEFHFAKSADYFRARNIRNGTEPPEYTHELITKMVVTADSSPTKWRESKGKMTK